MAHNEARSSHHHHGDDHEHVSVELSETSYLKLNPSDRQWQLADISHLPWDTSRHGPVVLNCHMYVEDIPVIHTADETFRIIIDVSWEWIDDRVLERNPGKPLDSINAWRISPDLKDVMWLPKLEVINAVEIETEEQALEALVRDGRPKIVQGMKYSITAKSRMRLHEFPFDLQRLQLIIRSSVWPKRDLEFQLQPHQERSVLGDFEPAVSLNEFKMERSFLRLAEHTYPMTAILEGEVAGLYSEWRFCLDVRRKPNYYLFKIVFPFLLIIVLNSLSMFCDASDIATRMSTSITLFLTAVAFQLVVSSDMPKIAYATRLDFFMNCQYVLLSLSIFFNMSNFRRTKERTNEDLVTSDRVAFWLYILTVIGSVLWFLRRMYYPMPIEVLDEPIVRRVWAGRTIGTPFGSLRLPSVPLPSPIRPDTRRTDNSAPLISDSESRA